MKSRLLRRFLADRVGLIAVFYLNTAFILALVGLLLSFEEVRPASIWANIGYAALLSTVLLVLYLGVGLMRWWPAARQLEVLLEQDADLAALANLPPGGTAEQVAFRTLLQKLHSLAVAEQHRYQEAHERHLHFIHLWVHQMKTPVSAISLLGQRAGTQSPTQLLAALTGVEQEAGKLADGLELVLGMARLQNFALDYHIRRVDLLGTVRRVVNARKKQFIRLGIFPEIAVAGEEWPVLTDEKWNGFAIDQIVANALKYASQAGPEGQKLQFELVRGERSTRLTITDQGPGIPLQDQPRIFEPFFTGENGRRYADATGIGLYLVKQVVDRLGHRVTVASEVERGTAVTLIYPDRS